jgi:hypothetical protein
MIRDPFYRQIINGLNNTLDPELFEQCAVDLLRSIYPTIVPIKGGNDSGMDGAIADGEGEPFPLITTISDKVMDNLTRNIESYVLSGGVRRKIIFATSRSLTPKKIQNLLQRAKELKFILIQVYSQDAIANLLYHNPKWCLELLNLVGDPAPLSIVPRTLRPLFNQELIGQQEALSWLNQKNGDKILIGQPGSGKTFLLYKLALEGNGLFVISNNRKEIAASIRAEQPEVLIIDDAHIKLELLLDIKHIRETTRAGFEIIASCWPGDKYQVVETLNLSESSIFELDLLTRDQIVEVIKEAGLSGSNELIREIVNQSEGRPGLAVTLTDICLKGGVKEVILGDTITKSILRFFGSKINSRTNEILAALSIGGDTGMQMLTVAQGLNLNIVDVRDVVTKLAAGGIVFEINRDYLSVRPAILRYALIRDIFFKGALSIPIEPFLDKTSSLTQTAMTLIGSVSRGAIIPEYLLIKILELANSNEVWLRYAWLGVEQSKWVLEHYPERLIEIAHPALDYIPKKVIPLLLEAAIGDKRELHSSPDHPLRLITDWVESGDPRTNEPIDRRELLLDIVLEWLQSKGDIDAGSIALKASLSPKFEIHTSDPGMGNTVTLSYGYLSLEHMIYIKNLWVKAFGSIKKFERINWRLVCNIIEEWAYCHVPVTPSKEVNDFMRSFAISMIKDIILIANNSMGVLRWADEIASNLKANLNVPLNTEFNILYPRERLKNWKQESINQASAVKELAKKWLNEDVDEIVKRIGIIENEAQIMKNTHLRWTPFLCSEIAKESTQPCRWIRAMMDNRMPCDLIEPFLKNAAIKNDIEWCYFEN